MPANAKTAKAADQNLYDAAAVQRIPFEVTVGSVRFETAHIINPITDEEQLDAIAERGDDGPEEAMRKIWRDHVKSVENTTFDGDFRDAIDESEIDSAILGYMFVGILKPQKVSTGVRDLSGAVTIKTQASFNGKLLEQTHTLRRRTDELRKKYDAIWDDANTDPRERAKAMKSLYGQIMTKVEGFKGNRVPLRFMVRVDRKSTRLNSSHIPLSRMPSSA